MRLLPLRAATNHLDGLDLSRTATTTVDLQAIHKGITDTVNALSDGLTKSAQIGAGDMSSCTCAPKECKDKKEDVCTVTVDVKEECKDVKKDKDFVSCETKCFKADHVVEINVPTVDLSSFHAAGTGERAQCTARHMCRQRPPCNARPACTCAARIQHVRRTTFGTCRSL